MTLDTSLYALSCLMLFGCETHVTEPSALHDLHTFSLLLQGGSSSHHGSAAEFKRSRSDSITSAGSNGSAHRRGVTLDHHSMNAHRRPLEEFLTALRKVCRNTLNLPVHTACVAGIGWCFSCHLGHAPLS